MKSGQHSFKRVAAVANGVALSALAVGWYLLTSAAHAQTPPAPAIDFATYLGSNLIDSITAVETDVAGNVYVLGTVPNDATALSFPFWNSIGQVPFQAPMCFLAKFTRTGQGSPAYAAVALIRDRSACPAMTIAPNGDVVIVAVGFPPTFVDTYTDVGGRFVRTRQVSLPQLSSARHVRVDAAGTTYVTGPCAQQGTPNTLWPLPGGVQPSPAPGVCSTPGSLDARDYQDLLVVLDATGQVTYGTFIGAGPQTSVSAMEVDANGGVFVAGQTVDGLALVTPNAYQPQRGDTACTSKCHPADAFLVAIDSAQQGLASLAYSSYFGGSSLERDIALALGAGGLVYLAGNTDSLNTFPGASFSDSAIFLSILDLSQAPAGQLLSSTAVVENGGTVMSGFFRLLPNGVVALMADSTSSDFPLMHPLYSAPYDLNAPNPVRPLLLVYDPATSAFTFATFLDDVQLARLTRFAIDPSGDVHVAMLTTETGRSTDGTVPLGQEDVLFFHIEGVPGSVTPGAVDSDADGVPDSQDNCRFTPNSNQADNDLDGTGDVCDTDDDNDGQSDADELACGSNPLDAASKAPDLDGDNRPDCVDTDDDGDGVPDGADNCPFTSNPSQADSDRDGIGDACDQVTTVDIDIVFSSLGSGGSRIYGMKADGTGLRQLTGGPDNDLTPSLSPDKSKIVFTRVLGLNFEIFVMNIDGAGLRRLTNSSSIDYEPVWSPDGTKIAFTSNAFSLFPFLSNWEVFVMNADGTGRINVSTSSATDWNPTWSPDGRKVAFASNRDGDFEIFTRNATAVGAVSQLTRNTADDTNPTWSPDGARIAFTSYRNGNAEIYAMDIQGTGQARLTNNSSADTDPDWGADGRILFSSTRNSTGDVFVMNADGSGVARLTNFCCLNRSPDW